MMMNRLVLGAALMSAAMAASAATVVAPGKTVNFVYDDSALGLFGTPTVVANSNTLIFNPTTFSAESFNSNGYALTHSTINIDVVALDPGASIKGASLSESGDYLRYGSTADVGAGGQLRATNLLNNVPPLVGPITVSTSLDPTSAFTPAEWAAGASVDTSGWNVSQLRITVQDLLGATSLQLGDGAFIQKKYASLTVSTVPIPGAALLFGPGLMAAFAPALRRRKKPAAA